MSLRRLSRTFVFFLTPWVVFAADTATTAPAETNFPKPALSTPPPSRISSAIRATLPAYTPPPPVVEKETSDTTTENIIFLNKVIVTESQLPKIGEWSILNDAGKAAFLKKHYPGATVPGNALSEQLPNYATLMRRDDERKANLKEMDESADLDLIKGDPAASKKLKEETQRALIRNPDWKTESMDKSYNNGRR